MRINKAQAQALLAKVSAASVAIRKAHKRARLADSRIADDISSVLASLYLVEFRIVFALQRHCPKRLGVACDLLAGACNRLEDVADSMQECDDIRAGQLSNCLPMLRSLLHANNETQAALIALCEIVG